MGKLLRLGAAGLQDLLRPFGVTDNVDRLGNPQRSVDTRDDGAVEAEAAHLVRGAIDQGGNAGDATQSRERFLHTRERRNALQ